MAAASNAALRVRYLAPAEITPAPRNARTHSPAQVQQIARSIGEFGFTNPILLDEASIILAGHGRLEAAQSLGLDKVPTITLAGLSDAQKRALALADNRLALSAGWDEDTLRLELGELGLAGYDLSLIGFSDDEMAAILGDPLDEAGAGGGGAGSLAEQFGIPPFSVLNAREGWWQDRKRAWLALGIQSELGRGEGAAIGGSPMPLDRLAPGGAPMPAADYSKRQRGDGRGRAFG